MLVIKNNLPWPAMKRTGHCYFAYGLLLFFFSFTACKTERRDAVAASNTSSVPRTQPQKAESGDATWFSATGMVVGLQTVMVKPRIDGQIIQVCFTEGQDVHRGDVLFVLDSRQLEVTLSQAEAVLARDRALLSNSKTMLGRDQELYDAKVIARQQLDTQDALVREQEASVAADLAQVDIARLQLSYTKIEAPIDGRIGLKQVDEGSYVRTSDPAGLAIVTQIQPISVMVFVPSSILDRLPKVTTTMGGRVEILSSDDRNMLGSGRLATMDTALDAATGELKLKAIVPNVERTMWPGQFVHVRVHIRSSRSGNAR